MIRAPFWWFSYLIKSHIIKVNELSTLFWRDEEAVFGLLALRSWGKLDAVFLHGRRKLQFLLRKSHAHLLQAVEFTTSLFSDEYRLYMTKPRNSISWTTYTNVFNSQYWIAVAATMFLLTPILNIVFKYEKVKIKQILWRTTDCSFSRVPEQLLWWQD